LEVTVHNWKRYVRSDLKRPSWFSFEVDFFGDSQFMGRWTPFVNQAFCYVVSQAIRSEGVAKINPTHMTGFCLLTIEQFESALEVLQEFGLVAVSRPDPVGTRPEPVRYMIPIQDDTNTGTTTASAPASVPVAPPSQPELELQDSRTYDRDHESVAVKPKPTDLPPLAKLWNERKHPDLGQVVMATGPRRKAANARWKEHPDEKFWADAIARVNASDFCLGRVESKDRGRPWKANFDWFVRPDTIAKILEGQYDNRSGPGGSSPSTKLSFWARQQANGGNA